MMIIGAPHSCPVNLGVWLLEDLESSQIRLSQDVPVLIVITCLTFEPYHLLTQDNSHKMLSQNDIHLPVQRTLVT